MSLARTYTCWRLDRAIEALREAEAYHTGLRQIIDSAEEVPWLVASRFADSAADVGRLTARVDTLKRRLGD